MDLTGKRVLVIGKGLSGNAACALATAIGATVYVYDDLDFLPTEYKQLSYSEVIRYVKVLDFAVVSPAVPNDHRLLIRLRENGVTVLSEPDFGYLNCSARLLAVTGTNGKTTTVEMASTMLSAAGRVAPAVGNIGLPLSAVAQTLKQKDFAVVEISSFQLEQSVCFRAFCSAITNIECDHIERHKTKEQYNLAKLKLFEMTDSFKIAEDSFGYRHNFGFAYGKEIEGVYCLDNVIYYKRNDDRTRIVSVDELNVKGVHNVKNVLCAMALCICANGGYDQRFAEAIKAYRPSKYRVEYLGIYGGRKIYNDSKGTNISATDAAIDLMDGATVLIMGGYDKGDDFREFFERLDPKVVCVYSYGANSAKVRKGAVEANKQKILVAVEDVESALNAVFAKEGSENLLYSPATSSFDIYTDYKQRGKAFEELIRERFKG